MLLIILFGVAVFVTKVDTKPCTRNDNGDCEIDCSGTKACMNDILDCDDGQGGNDLDCVITCDGTKACAAATILIPESSSKDRIFTLNCLDKACQPHLGNPTIVRSHRRGTIICESTDENPTTIRKTCSKMEVYVDASGEEDNLDLTTWQCEEYSCRDGIFSCNDPDKCEWKIDGESAVDPKKDADYYFICRSEICEAGGLDQDRCRSWVCFYFFHFLSVVFTGHMAGRIPDGFYIFLFLFLHVVG